MYELPKHKKLRRRRRYIDEAASILFPSSKPPAVAGVLLNAVIKEESTIHREEALNRLEELFGGVLLNYHATVLKTYPNSNNFERLQEHFENILQLPSKCKREKELNAYHILYMFESYVTICRLEMWLRELENKDSGLRHIIRDFSGKELPVNIINKIFGMIDEFGDLGVKVYTKAFRTNTLEEDFYGLLKNSLADKTNRMLMKQHNRCQTVISHNIRIEGYGAIFGGKYNE